VDERAPVPLEPDAVDPIERHRRDLLAALLVERFTPYRPPPTVPLAPERSTKGAA